MKLRRFLIYYLLYALLVAGLALGLQFFLAPMQLLSTHFWLLFLVLFVLTLVAYIVSDVGIRKGGGLSVLSIMGGIFVKMLLSLALIAFLIIKFPENKMLTAMNFFSLYLLFTVFEIICLLRNLRDQIKSYNIGDK